ncbi:MAG TPA: phage portal protein, partial [Candidatus Eisenbacteria bacterium]|nr:phage portal protein [Candidatus Eisenbacteria bacterium]
TGKVLAYWFKKTDFNALLTGGVMLSQDKFDRIPVYDDKGRKQIIHKFKCRRPGQRRGIPEGFSVFNMVRDNMDLHKLEMQAAKLASDIANVETNAAGEFDALTIRRARMGILTQDSNGNPISKSVPADYNVSIGAKSIALKTGDRLDQFMISRPTVATQQYWDLHYTLICIGYNVPKMLVMPYSLQGTVTRADLDICSFGFGREHFEIVRELLEEVYAWQTQWAVDYDRSLDGDTPEDFLCVFIRPPRPPNVDVGYTAKALEIELKLGVKTIPEVYAEKQQDFRQKTREIAEYLSYVNKLAKEFKVEASQITSLAAASITEPDKPTDPEEVSTEKKEGVAT